MVVVGQMILDDELSSQPTAAGLESLVEEAPAMAEEHDDDPPDPDLKQYCRIFHFRAPATERAYRTFHTETWHARSRWFIGGYLIISIFRALSNHFTSKTFRTRLLDVFDNLTSLNIGMIFVFSVSPAVLLLGLSCTRFDPLKHYYSLTLVVLGSLVMLAHFFPVATTIIMSNRTDGSFENATADEAFEFAGLASVNQMAACDTLLIIGVACGLTPEWFLVRLPRHPPPRPPRDRRPAPRAGPSLARRGVRRCGRR